MNVLWISNIPFGPLCELPGQSKATSGSWLDAAFASLEHVEGLNLTIVTVSRVKERTEIKLGKHYFILLPGGFPFEYDCNATNNKKEWDSISREFKPDLIQVWGTEYTHGYLALQVMQEIPSVIYMQGLMGQIARYYLSGISPKDLRQSITLRDILKWDWIRMQQSNFRKGSLYEAKMIQIAGNVIVENKWCETHCKAISNACNVYKSKLSIKEDFFNEKWNPKQMIPFTIMSNAGGYPIKGLHVLLKALSIVIKKYPNVQLLIPGEDSLFENSFFEKLKRNGYSKFIVATITKLKLRNNITYLGKLTSKQMAKQMAMSNVFVLPSSIENHSSTLIEAMVVGVPCIASYVGGVPEYVNHEANGLLYRFEESEILASYIDKIFENLDFATNIASRGRLEMRESRSTANFKQDLLEVYHKMLNTQH